VFNPLRRTPTVAATEAGAAAAAVAKAREAATVYGGTAREWATPRVERVSQATTEWATPRVEIARVWATPHVENARVWATPHVEAAREWAGPHVDEAVERARAEVLPKLAAAAAAATAALAATEPVREEAKTRGNAAYLALKGELAPPTPRRRRGKRFLLLTGIGGAAGAAWYAWQQRSGSDPWSGSDETWSGTYSSTSAPVDTAAAASATTPAESPPFVGASDDAAGASPDEALADSSTPPGPAAPADVEAAVGEYPIGTTGGDASEVVDPTADQTVAEEVYEQHRESAADARSLRQFP
jgi:hypothetical protein